MLSVAVHKDIGEYQPKLVGKMTGRTLFCLTGGVGVAILSGLYITIVLGLDFSDYSIVIMALAFPFWAAGFWKPQGMKAEIYAKYWIEYNFTRKQILDIPSFMLIGYVERNSKRKEKKYDKEQRKLSQLPGIEAYSAKAGRVI